MPWVRHWAGHGDAPVLHDRSVGWLSAAEMEDRTRRAAGWLATTGVQPGQRVLLCGQAPLDLAILHVAVLRLGLVSVPVNPAFGVRELGHVVTDARPSVAVVAEDRHRAWIRDAAPVPLTVASFAEVRRGADLVGELDQAGPDDLALMVYTSGTTGVPKGAPLTHGNLAASTQAVAMAWRWSHRDRLVLALPLFHLHGLGVGLHGTLTAGASAVLQPSFDPGEVVGAVRDHRASLFFGVPTMYQRLATSGRIAELGGLRLSVSGSAPLPAALHRNITAGSGQVVLERYGMSETVMNVSNPYEGERRPGTVGFALPGVEVRLDVDHETGDPDLGVGDILVRGPNVFGGYWERPEATAASFVDGWFRTGDIGSFDGDGYLSIVGRSKDLIITGGSNVYPREVEDVLRGHPGVGDVAVVGVADDQWGEVVVAFVEGDADDGALMALARDQLAPYKRPKRIHRLTALPRNALGKVVKAGLCEP